MMKRIYLYRLLVFVTGLILLFINQLMLLAPALFIIHCSVLISYFLTGWLLISHSPQITLNSVIVLSPLATMNIIALTINPGETWPLYAPFTLMLAMLGLYCGRALKKQTKNKRGIISVKQL